MIKKLNFFLIFLVLSSTADNINKTPKSNIIDYKKLDSNQKMLINHVIKSIENAYLGKSKLTEEVFKIRGMSSPRGRMFLNNICSLKGASYLEIGTWIGSTLVSALYKNEDNVSKAFAIDNFSQFNADDVKLKLLENINNFLFNNNVKFYDAHAFRFDLDNLSNNKFNIYFYDGHHSELSQYLAFSYYNNVFEDTFIAIIDDYNWSNVKDGTKRAFNDLNYKILYEQFLPSKHNADTDTWWNGTYVAVISKK